MYIIETKNGNVAFKDNNICAVSVEKVGWIFASYTLIVGTKYNTIRVDDLKKDIATVHYSVLHDMIIDQEG